VAKDYALSEKDGQIDIAACLLAAATVPASTDNPLWEAALNDAPDVFHAKFEHAVKAHAGFSPKI
jgi:hypothetical protein